MTNSVAPDIKAALDNTIFALQYAMNFIPQTDPLLKKVSKTLETSKAALAKARSKGEPQ